MSGSEKLGPRIFDSERQCGSGRKGKPLAGPCRNPKGFKTDHVGSGRCFLHGGSTPNGRKHAQSEAAKAILAELAIPVAGNPLQVLQAALESAHGLMLGARRMLRELPETAAAGVAEARLNVYVKGMAQAADIAKKASEAINEDELVKLDKAQGAMIHRILTLALDAYESAGTSSGSGRDAAEEVLIRELVAAGPTADERN